MLMINKHRKHHPPEVLTRAPRGVGRPRVSDRDRREPLSPSRRASSCTASHCQRGMEMVSGSHRSRSSAKARPPRRIRRVFLTGGCVFLVFRMDGGTSGLRPRDLRLRSKQCSTRLSYDADAFTLQPPPRSQPKACLKKNRHIVSYGCPKKSKEALGKSFKGSITPS